LIDSPTGHAAEDAYGAFLAELREDDNVVGAILVGPRAVGRLLTPTSDHDVYIVLREPGQRYRFVHGDPIEEIPLTIEEFARRGLPGSGSEWDRPAFLNARVDIDKLDGEIRRLVHAKARLSDQEARSFAAAALDDYVNSMFRSLKNHEAGRTIAGRLDAAESIPALLTALFAFEGRVRPFNKWLLRELARSPLTIRDLPERLEALLEGEPAVQRGMFGIVEGLARERGHGDVIDGWEPDVVWLRGAGRT